jgi:hypothetical protein
LLIKIFPGKLFWLKGLEKISQENLISLGKQEKAGF